MSSFDLINLMILIQNLPLNFDVAFYNWLKILPLTNTLLSNILILFSNIYKVKQCTNIKETYTIMSCEFIPAYQ